MKKQKTIIMMGLFIALSIIGGYIKIPNPVTSSIAFDSLPAFLASLVLGGLPGAAVAFLGHMLSAALGGFPMSLPIHLVVAVEMGIIMVVFSFIANKINLIVAIIAGIILNGIVSPVILIFIPNLGLPVFLASLLPLMAASIFNVILAAVVFSSIKNVGFVKEIQEAK
ncbi:hypothetical protein OXPF_12590 [Oxobacter pfennigii]|uniref:Alpha-ribazole transporter n=1 Tax=Oxobacter pfennigii TaxID=36849 RepID=A0A0P8WB27_9CLOT|nr:ECF transporter S component [Oxobacter pfennigii]KPU45132.1 hypothetical protein OXPF_12590 [Oxobacter pfennigii]